MRKLILSLGSILAAHAFAINYSDGSFGNYGFLHQSALGKCAQLDGTRFTSALISALNHAADGNTVQWLNEKTGNRGRIELLKDHSGPPNCRLARIGTADQTIEGQELYQFCKENGRWFAHAR